LLTNRSILFYFPFKYPAYVCTGTLVAGGLSAPPQEQISDAKEKISFFVSFASLREVSLSCSVTFVRMQ
jgi:hypothetical protein